MITVRHRAMHEGKPYTVWQTREQGKPPHYAATFDRPRESVQPIAFPHATMFQAVDAMTEGTVPEIAPAPVNVKGQPSLVGQLQLWDQNNETV